VERIKTDFVFRFVLVRNVMTSRQGVTRSVWVCGFAFLVACGSDKRDDFIAPGGEGGASATGNRGGSGGRSGVGGRGGAAGGGTSGSGSGGMASVLAPVIDITAPVGVTDPNVGPVLVDDQVTVLCSVKDSAQSGAKPVDPSSVKIEIFDADGKSLKSNAGAPTANKFEYSATFVLTDLPSGGVSFGCSASDTATPQHSATATLATLLDRGPEITIGEPLDKSAHNLLGPMNVEFTATASPITDADKQADVSGVKLVVSGVTIPTVEQGDGRYQASVDFTDKNLFSSPPSGAAPIVITASNGRKKPGKATRALSYGIVVDGVGPVIALAAPQAKSVIGRASILTFNVTDAGSNVDRATVAVKLNEETKFFSATDNQWTWDASGAFSFRMGAALANNADTQVTVNVLAKDQAGNASTGNSRIYYLDNKPPIVDLDPPNVYEVRSGTEPDTMQCSDVFDPLGAFDGSLPPPPTNGSPNDLSTIVNFGRFRSLIWDLTNTKAGQSETYPAYVDRDSARIYVQTNTDSPLLADDDHDGICDEIWTGSIPHQRKPTDKPLPFVKMIYLAPTGGVSWGHAAPNVAECKAGNVETAARLCSSPGVSDMSVVIRHPTGAQQPFEPVIYAIEPDSNPLSLTCTGIQWEISSAITMAEGANKLGWVCIAARAMDTVGNVGISPPLRVCLDDGTNPDRCKGMPPPSCTDACTPPPHFNISGPVRHN
jgi:hypothetical protein